MHHSIQSRLILLRCELSLLLDCSDTCFAGYQRWACAGCAKQSCRPHIAGLEFIDRRCGRIRASTKRHVLRGTDGFVGGLCALDGADTTTHQSATQRADGRRVDTFLGSLGCIQRLTGTELLDSCLGPFLCAFNRHADRSGCAGACNSAADAGHLLHTLAANLDATSERAKSEHVGQRLGARGGTCGQPCARDIGAGDGLTSLLRFFDQAAIDIAGLHSEVLPHKHSPGAQRRRQVTGSLCRSCRHHGLRHGRRSFAGEAHLGNLGGDHLVSRFGGAACDECAQRHAPGQRAESAGGDRLDTLPDDVPGRVLDPVDHLARVFAEVIPRVGEFDGRCVLLVFLLFGGELAREVILGCGG